VKKLLGFGGVVLGIVVLMFGVGLLVPADHAARCTVLIRKEPAELWTTVVDFERWAEWNAGIERVVPGPSRDQNDVWLVTADFGEAELEVTKLNEPTELETRMSAGSFTGTWTYEFLEVPAGTTLTITERGTVSNPLFRTMMLFTDEHGSMKDFMLALGTEHGLEVEPREVDAEG
jgi:hypothetical protein